MMPASRSVLLAAAVLAVAVPVRAQTADEVVQKYLAALGGRAVLEKSVSQIATGTISVSVQGNDIGGPLEVYHKAPNKVRTYFKLDLSAVGAGEMTVDQRCDGKTAYASNSMQGDREITGTQLQNLLNATYPTPLLDYKGAGAKIELAGKEKLDGKDVYVLVYTPKAGSPSKQYYDAASFLLLRTVQKMDVPEMGGEVEQTSNFADYRAVDGVQVPFSMTIVNSMQTIGIKIAKVEHNKPIDDAMFSKPAAK